ncbi:MAG: fatty acid desaturase [Myxococcota bacterium]
MNRRISAPRRGDLRGLLIACGVIGSWAVLLLIGLATPVTGLLDLVWVVPAVAVLTLLYTGLFITAHDAMHGSLLPGRPAVGHAIGTVCAFVYAFMSYEQLRVEHLRHHASPGQAGADPDFHDGKHPGLIRWFVHFMVSYVTIRQVVLLVLAFVSLLLLAQVPWPNVLLFWALPSLASTLQLFIVGTWWPHHARPGEPMGEHHSRSLNLPTIVSFLACFHFGYHHEHHEQPELPWWRLPAAYRAGRLSTPPPPA